MKDIPYAASVNEAPCQSVGATPSLVNPPPAVDELAAASSVSVFGAAVPRSDY